MERLGNALINLMQDLSRLSTNGNAKVRVNENLADPQEFKALFNHFSRGTILDHVDLEVEPTSARMACGCGHEQEVNGEHSGYKRCPSCGRFAEVRDTSYQLVEPDPSVAGPRKSIRF